MKSSQKHIHACKQVCLWLKYNIRKDNKKGYVQGDEEGINAGNRHKIWKTICSYFFSSRCVMDSFVLVVDNTY